MVKENGSLETSFILELGSLTNHKVWEILSRRYLNITDKLKMDISMEKVCSCLVTGIGTMDTTRMESLKGKGHIVGTMGLFTKAILKTGLDLDTEFGNMALRNIRALTSTIKEMAKEHIVGVEAVII
jgi:hypothetical protein